MIRPSRPVFHIFQQDAVLNIHPAPRQAPAVIFQDQEVLGCKAPEYISVEGFRWCTMQFPETLPVHTGCHAQGQHYGFKTGFRKGD